MVYCCVPDCKSHQERDKLISFHEFPSDEELRKIWLKNIPRKDFIPNDTSASSVVCSKHFKEDDYVPSLKNRRLKRGSVPTVFQDNLKFKTPALEKNIQIRKLLPKIDMAAVDEVQLLSKIQDTYVPFLKKLIAFLEKNKKATPENLTKLKAIYTIFTTAPSSEQVETFYANQKKLENWYNKAQKEKHAEDGETKGTKRGLVLSDTESSQGGKCSRHQTNGGNYLESDANFEDDTDLLPLKEGLSSLEKIKHIFKKLDDKTGTSDSDVVQALMERLNREIALRENVHL